MFTITVDTDDSVPYDIQEQTFVTNGGDKMAVTKGKKQENVSDKDKALEAALMQITKQYGQGAVMKLGDDNAALNVEAISTGSISLDLAIAQLLSRRSTSAAKDASRFIDAKAAFSGSTGSVASNCEIAISSSKSSALIVPYLFKIASNDTSEPERLPV